MLICRTCSNCKNTRFNVVEFETYCTNGGKYGELCDNHEFDKQDGCKIKDYGEEDKICKCGNKDLERYDKYYEEHGIVEYKLLCPKCKETVGIWDYGYWENFQR